jgi:two-component system chemotaxis response regulator CheB
MTKQNVVVIGASTGGLEGLQALVAELPADFPAPVFVVWHVRRDYPSQLAQILASSTSLAVKEAQDGEPIRPGHIYVARPDYHLLVDPEQVRVTRGPTENGMRPSIDVLFRSAAVSQGGRVVSVILSGTLDDGVSGAFAVKERGGVTIVQDPVDALYEDLPLKVMEALKLDFVLDEVDYVLSIEQMGAVLRTLVAEDSVDETLVDEPSVDEEKGADMLPRLKLEVGIAREDHALERGVLDLGTPSLFTCPECHGTLLQFQEGQRTRFRCHTGHAFSTSALLAEITQHVEEGLWSAVRAMEESHMLLQYLGEHLQGGQPEAAQLFLRQAQKINGQKTLVRQVAIDSEVLSEEKIRRQPAPETPTPENPASEDLPQVST